MKEKYLDEYILNGKRIGSPKGFYNQVQKVLTRDFDGFGRNLDAFNDILSGGFGCFDVDEEFILVWKHFSESQAALKPAFLADVQEIIESHEHITFIKHP